MAREIVETEYKPRIISWDLECTSLKASFGYLLCFGYKVLGEDETHVISIADFKKHKKDPTNDHLVVKAAAKVLSDADMWITWNGKRFDVPFITTRLLFHGEKPLPRVPHLDGLQISRKHLRMHSNRLDAVSVFFNLQRKTPLNGPEWIRAAAGHKPSIEYIIEHCRQDVVVLEEVYNILRPLAALHPNVAQMAGKTFACPVCGSKKVQKRGLHRNRVCARQRYQCTKCGAWSSGGPIIESTTLR
jgi:uncharacterized protein YprB with RNaseH-like and TPR domain